MASTFLRESVSANGNKKKWTISVWVKRSGLGANTIMSAWYADSTSGHMSFGFDSEDRLDLSTWSVNVLTTNRKFRDTNAWYHIQVAVDTDESTADNRARFYVNGVEETSFSTRNNKSSGFEYSVNNSSSTHNIGGNLYSGTTNLFDGYMSHFHFIDGQQYAPTVFGSTDSTTGEWKINTSPTATYGTNGFFILKDGNSVTDQSGQGNNLTVQAGTLSKSEDNPSNVFATLNVLTSRSTPTYSNGNLKTGSSSDGNYVIGTVPSKAGYYEIKLGQNPDGSSGSGLTFGTFDSNYSDYNLSATNIRMYKTNHAYAATYSVDDLGGGNSWEGTNTGVSASSGDIINVAWKNGKLYVGKNGTYFFSANPSNDTDGSTQVLLYDSNAYQLPISKSNVSGMTNSEWNFGNGYFGTTAITTNSGNGYQDANGQGKFQYQPPTGCYALCTKNLNL